MMTKECNDLFNKLWWLSDIPEVMEEFVEAMKEWTNWNGGNIRIVLINLHELENSFPNNELYIGYDDCSGCGIHPIYDAGDFIKYIQEIYNDYAEDLCPEGYWVDKLNGLLKKYRS